MLLLILTNRNGLGFVDQNVRCHQDGVVEEPGVDQLLLFHCCCLVFVLRHPLQFTHGCQRRKQPHQFAMRRNLRLHKERRLLWIKAERQIIYRCLVCPLPKLIGIRRFRQGMQIRDKEEALVLLLQCNELLDGPQVVTKVELTRWLNTRNNSHTLLAYSAPTAESTGHQRRDSPSSGGHATLSACRGKRETCRLEKSTT